MESRASQLRIIASRPLLEKGRDPLTKEFHVPMNIRRFIPHTLRRESGRSRALRIGRFILRGRGPLYELLLIDVSLNRTSIMFPPGTHLGVGEIFEIVRPIRTGDDSPLRPKSPRKVVALVKVIGVGAESRAVVNVLWGSVIKGYWAERVDEDRIADLLYPSLSFRKLFPWWKPQARR
jgi:hypothetical protein